MVNYTVTVRSRDNVDHFQIELSETDTVSTCLSLECVM